MSGIRRNTKRTFTQKDKRSFHLVGSDLFFGLVFASKQSYYYKVNRNLVTTPSFTFYSNQTKVIIDYSNSKNADDLSYIASFFNSLTSGITFEYTDTIYVNDASGTSADLSGIYQFTSFEQNKLIKASVVSSTSISSSRDFYNSKFFTDTPQLNKSGGVSDTQQRTNIIKNTIPNGLYSFTRLGVVIGDYVDFSGTDNNKWTKLKVKDLFVDTDGFECIEVESEITDENLIGNAILVNLYFEGESSTEVNLNNKTYGTCVLTYANGSSRCLPCQNEFQCPDRSAQLKALSSTYTPYATCDDIDSLSTTVATPVIATVVATPTVTLTSTDDTTALSLSSTVRPKTTVKNLSIKIATTNGKPTITEDGIPLSELTVGIDTTLKILTSDPTLLNYSFAFSSTNPEKLVTPIVDNIINTGKPGTSSSYISIQTGKQNKEIYLTSSSNRSLFFKIKIIK
jgi:hypothetical protein